MIPISTPSGEFRVWTKRVGTNPDIKVLLLHGGPGATDELYECFDVWFPGAGIEYYYYDQLGSAYSDQPDEPSLWDLPRFVEEVEQVRVALLPSHQQDAQACHRIRVFSTEQDDFPVPAQFRRVHFPLQGRLSVCSSCYPF